MAQDSILPTPQNLSKIAIVSHEKSDSETGVVSDDGENPLDCDNFTSEAAQLPQDGIVREEVAQSPPDFANQSYDSALGDSILSQDTEDAEDADDTNVPLIDAYLSADKGPSERKIGYKIFYQSLEDPDQLAKKLAREFNLQNGNVATEQKKDPNNEYNKDVQQQLSEYFGDIAADIVVIGEYRDPRYKEGVETDFGGYKIVGVVGEEARDDRRAMTVYCTTKRPIEGCRITTLDGSKVKSKYLDDNFENERKAYESKSQKRLEELSNSAKDTIGQCIEIMVYNRYMLFAHIKGMGKGARDSLEKLLRKCGYIKQMDNGEDSITYLIAGDLNAENKTGTHSIDELYGIMRFCANTNVLAGHETDVQKLMNIPGRSSSAKVKITCHDGTYRPIITSDRTEYKQPGSLWVIREVSEEISRILSDHKGFLLEVTVTHSDRNSPTQSFTPLPDEAIDEGVDDANPKPLVTKQKVAVKTKNEVVVLLESQEPVGQSDVKTVAAAVVLEDTEAVILNISHLALQDPTEIPESTILGSDVFCT